VHQLRVCVDLCQVRWPRHDRPRAHGRGQLRARGLAQGEAAVMTVFPIQTAACTGCMVCTMVMPDRHHHYRQWWRRGPLRAAAGAPCAGAGAQARPVAGALRLHSHVAHVPAVGDPWGSDHKWRPVRRVRQLAGLAYLAAPGRISRRVRRRYSERKGASNDTPTKLSAAIVNGLVSGGQVHGSRRTAAAALPALWVLTPGAAPQPALHDQEPAQLHPALRRRRWWLT